MPMHHTTQTPAHDRDPISDFSSYELLQYLTEVPIGETGP